MTKYRLQSLEIINFRGFRGKVSIPFDRPIVAIYGPVGAGKSSIVQAIEYALYGKQLEIKERIAKLADLINEEESEARVTLTLVREDTGEQLRVMRALKRVGDSAREHQVELVIGGKKVASTVRDVTDIITEILRLDEEDFSRFILVTHRVLEGLVYGTSTRRSLTIDKLFGIDILENIYKSIPIRKVEEILEQEKSKLSAYKELPEIISRYGSVEEARRALDRIKREIEELKKLEEELQKKYAKLIEERNSILKSLRDLENVYIKYLQIRSEREKLEEEISGKESDVSETSIKIELDLIRSFLVSKLEELLFSKEAEELAKLSITSQNLEEAALKIYDILKRLEDALSRFDEEKENLAKAHEELKVEAERLSSEIRNIERRLRELESQFREYQELENKYGQPEAIRSELERLRELVEKTTSDVGVVSAIITILQAIASGRLDTCPVCGRELSDKDREEAKRRIEELRERHRKVLDEIENARRRITELEQVLAKMESLKPIVSEYEELYTKLKMLRENYSRVVAKLENIDKNRRFLEKRAQVLRFLIDEVRSRLDKVDEALTLLKKIKRYRELLREEKELEQKLRAQGFDLSRASRLEEEISEVSRRLEQTRERLNALSVEASRLEQILSSIPVETVEELRNRVYKLEDLYKKLNTIRNVLRKIQKDLRERMIERTRSLVDQYFRMIYPHPDLTGASIEISTRERLGVLVSEYVLYGIRRGGRKVPISRMSDGQRLTLALAFMLSVYSVASHNVSFLIMDEPIPYVDVEVRKAFASLITRLITERLVSQLVITSQSREFIDQIVQEARSKNVPVELIEIERIDGDRRVKVSYVD